jgi:methionyl aminopeptidase
MAITIKTKEEIDTLRAGGRRLAFIMQEIVKAVAPGVSSLDLDILAYKLAVDGGDKPSFLNYRPAGIKKAYPASLCVSVNDEIVHGIPNDKVKILKEGDIVSLDMGLNHKGLFTDHAITVGVGQISIENQKLIDITRQSLYEGIQVIKPGKRIQDISYAIEKYIRPHHLGIVEDLCGHGVGHKVHEDPYIPNYCLSDKGDKIKEGMVLALEPMVNAGTKHITLDSDSYTYRTADGKNSAHFEHTVVVTRGGVEILTEI